MYKDLEGDQLLNLIGKQRRKVDNREGMKTSKISKVLVAIDGSRFSMEAAKYAVTLAKKYDAELIALTIINTQPWFHASSLYGWASSETMEKIHESDIHHAQTWLDQVKETAEKDGVRSQTKILLVPYTQSSTAGAIVNYAEENHIDLIMIGTKGYSGIKKMLLGSVALAVVSYSHCPVLVVK
ncbi:MAG: universal stress protein [Nitrososphaeraceae archaeon]